MNLRYLIGLVVVLALVFFALPLLSGQTKWPASISAKDVGDFIHSAWSYWQIVYKTVVK